ncbi:MAG TPA: HAD family phosphatase, partial [Gemmatimonadales bacterium]|nr:HAD family phosphatase [Gemmatimonadales bacterium]
MDALLLDFNGVVVDDEPLHLESFRRVLFEVGISISDADYQELYLGLDDRGAFREAYSRASRTLATELERALIQRKAEHYAELAARRLPVVPGVAEFVRGAADAARIAIVSGALRREIEAGLDVAGIAAHVDVVVSSEATRSGKPDPECFRLALRELAERHGSGRWRACVVEDSLPGLAAARA